MRKPHERSEQGLGLKLPPKRKADRREAILSGRQIPSPFSFPRAKRSLSESGMRKPHEHSEQGLGLMLPQ